MGGFNGGERATETRTGCQELELGGELGRMNGVHVFGELTLRWRFRRFGTCISVYVFKVVDSVYSVSFESN